MSLYCNINTDKTTITITNPIKQIIVTKGIVDVIIETVEREYDTAINQLYLITIQYTSTQQGTWLQQYFREGKIGALTIEYNNAFVFLVNGNPPSKERLQGNANAPENFTQVIITEIKEYPSGVISKKKYQYRLIINRGDNGTNIYSSPYLDSIPSYTVGCEGCPPGHIKCECNTFPGYCCIPCSEILGRVDSMTNHLRSIKRG